MTNLKRYAISLKKDVVIPTDTSTNPSRFRVLEYWPLRRFTTRREAREFRNGYINPSRYSIIDTHNQQVVR